MDILTIKSCEKVANTFYCKDCDYNTCRKSSFDKHTSTLKHKNATKNPKIFECIKCEYTTCRKSSFDKHTSTLKHKNATETPNLFECKYCLYSCSKKCDWTKHILTLKHNNRKKNAQEEKTIYECLCGKKYNERTGLWKHKKKCEQINKSLEYEDSEDSSSIQYKNDNDILVHLLKKSNQLQQQIINLLEKNN